MFVVAIILAVLTAIVLLVALFGPKETENSLGDTVSPRKVARRIALGLGFLTLVFGLLASVYNQSVGTARVIINAGGTISHTDETPGFGFKAPWQKAVDFDLFSQELKFAGNGEGAPDYTGGSVNGQQVTVSVKGGAQSNVDVSVTYSLDSNAVEGIYKEYRSQERFNQQVVVPTTLNTIRGVPSEYTPVQFRGEKRGEAQDKMIEALNNRLESKGINVTNVNIQDIRFTDEVEGSIKAVEVAQQKEAEAQANLRATEVSAQAQVVEAQAEADAAIAKAQGDAEANRLLSESLTPQVLQQRYIEAISKAGTVIVGEGTGSPLINIPAAPPAQ